MVSVKDKVHKYTLWDHISARHVKQGTKHAMTEQELKLCDHVNSSSSSCIISVYAKPRLSQVNVRQNLSATGRNFEFTCHNDFWQILLYIQ